VGSAGKADVVRRQLDLDAGAIVRYDEAGWEKDVLKATGGRGVDVVFDTVGLVEKSLRCLRYGGRIVVAGFAGLEGKMEKVAMNRILLKGAVVLGYVRETREITYVGNADKRSRDMAKEVAEILQRMRRPGAD
jgi:NADPH:quinone reductase